MNQTPVVSTEEHSSIISCGNRPVNPFLIENILQTILKFLKAPERNIARLVCKLWFDVCNHERFTKKEAFYIANMNDYETVMDVLNNSQRKTFNLKFFRSLFDQNSIPLWNTFGNRIESLSFNRCTFHVGIIPFIFEMCENLVEFTLRFVEFVNNPESRNYSNQKEGLATFLSNSVLLPKGNIVRKKLTTFCWKFNEFNDNALRNGHLKRFASIFPELKILKLCMYHSIAEDNVLNVIDTFYSPIVYMWVELLATKLKAIESFDVQFFPRFCHTGLNLEDLSVFNKNDMNNLKKMALPINETFFDDDEYLNTIFAFKFWTSFITDCDDNTTGYVTTLVKLIEANPQLEELHIQLSTWDATDMRILFAALLTSQLQFITFALPNDVVLPESDIFEVDLDLEPWPINNTVRRLEIVSIGEIPERDDLGLHVYRSEINDEQINFCLSCHRSIMEFSSFCLKYFQNIRYLNAQPGDVDLIFKYQTNLKQLEIIPFQTMSRSETVFVVESLEVLHVRRAVHDILPAYRFPNLKSLFILDYNRHMDQLATEIFIEQFNRMSQLILTNAPNIEFLHIVGNSSFEKEAYIVFFKSCLTFTKLRYVSISIDSTDLATSKEDLKAEMLKYMPLCSSLRTVWLNTDDWTVSLVFNIIDKTFKLTESHKEPDPDRQITYEGVDLRTFYFRKR